MEPKLNPPHLSTQQGLTLTELLLSVAILAILASLAYPSLRSAFQKAESQRIQNILHDAIKQAKAQSRTQHQHVILCPTNQSNQCDRNNIQAILLFFDNNDNHLLDTNEQIILKENIQPKYGNIILRASARRNYIKFWANDGTPRGHIGHFSYCTEDPIYEYQISFNQVGTTRIRPYGTYIRDCQ